MKNTKLCLYILLFFSLPVICPDSSLAQTKSARIRKLLNQPKHKKTLFSVHFYDLTDNKTVFSFNADRPEIPASNLKLVTTAAALDLLGPDFAYETHYGTLENNLAIIASGDPLLADPVIAGRQGRDIYHIFNQLLEQLRQKNITNITGDLIIDDLIFDNIRFHPSWPIEQANRWFAAEVSALNFNDNCLDITFKPSASPGTPARYNLTPDTQYVSITNKCKTTAKRKTAVGATRVHNTNKITLQGYCKTPITNPIFVTINRPSAYHGFVLIEFLLANGITIDGQLVIKNIRQPDGTLPTNFQTLLTVTTPLRDVLPECNQRSLNLAAECLLKTIGAYSPGSQQGSWQTGQAGINSFLKKLNIPPAQFNIDDGSGLSKKNRLSARALTTVLTYMHRHKSSDLYRNSMATPSVGTLKKRKRFSQPTYKNRIFAKTGVIKNSRTLSGYCKTKAGHWLAFSILTNSPAAPTGLIDKIVKEMID